MWVSVSCVRSSTLLSKYATSSAYRCDARVLPTNMWLKFNIYKMAVQPGIFIFKVGNTHLDINKYFSFFNLKFIIYYMELCNRRIQELVFINGWLDKYYIRQISRQLQNYSNLLTSQFGTFLSSSVLKSIENVYFFFSYYTILL